MKRYFLSAIAVAFFVSFSHAQGVLRIWTGKTNTDWQNDENWDLTLGTSGLDEYIFNGTLPITVTNIPATVNAGSLTINSNVTFSGGETLVNFNIASPGISFTIATGGALTINASGNFTINLNPGAKAAINGNLTFTKPSGSSAHKLLSTDKGSIVFNTGSTFIQNCNSNVFGNSGSKDIVRFLSGSKFVFLSGGNPFGLSQPNSKVIFEKGSVYFHRTVSLPSFKGRLYANFEYDNSNLNNNILILNNNLANNQNVTIQIDTLIISKGTLSVEPSSFINFNLKGNLIVKAGAAFKMDNASSGSSQVNFSSANGSQAILVDPAGICAIGSLRVSNNNILSITHTVSIRDSLIFSSGKINTEVGLLTLGENVTNSKIIGSSSTQYVVGSLSKVFGATPEEFTFPIGKEGNSGFVKILPQTSNSSFTGKYFKSPAPKSDVHNYSGLMNVSSIEYWEVTGSLNSSAVVSIAYGSHSNVSHVSDVRVAVWDEANTHWKSLGPELGDVSNSGFVKAALPVSFSTQIFTLGSESGDNALPVNFDSFEGYSTNGSVILSWTTSDERNNRQFEVEKSPDGIVFYNIATLASSTSPNTNKSYSFTDHKATGTPYYRIRQVDFNGDYTFSEIIQVNTEMISLNAHIQPNPGKENFDLILNEDYSGPVAVEVASLQGVHLESFAGNIKQANNWLNEALSETASGIYYIKIRLSNCFKTLRLIKN